MSCSLEQQILAVMQERLNGAPLGPLPRPEDLVVERSRLREISPTQLPSVSIYPMEGTTERSGFMGSSKLTVKIAIWVKGTAGVPVDADLDPIWMWIHQQLMADESLGGLSIRIEPAQKTWGFAVYQNPFGDLDLHYLITYRHQVANPSFA